MKKMIKITGCLWLLLVAITLQAQDDATARIKNFNLDKGLAIQGYDPVAYFIEGKAAEGKETFSYTWKGATYRFASVKHKELFVAHPEQYQPQYGGWCAYAMGASGEKVEVDPETFKIIDGKLFLFYNAYFNNTLKKWNADEKSLHDKADANWKRIVKL